MNNVTKVLVHYIQSNDECCNCTLEAQEIVKNLIVDHSDHHLIMALACSSLENADWEEIASAIESIKNKQ